MVIVMKSKAAEIKNKKVVNIAVVSSGKTPVGMIEIPDDMRVSIGWGYDGKDFIEPEKKVLSESETALNEIKRLELLETPRRIAEAMPDSAGGSTAGRAWLKANRASIAEQRKLL